MSRYSAFFSMAALLMALGLVCGHVGQEKQFQLVGFTSATVLGDVGVFGMTETCQAEFPGSRFCTLEEVHKTVVIPSALVTGEAWVDWKRETYSPSCYAWSGGSDGLVIDSAGRLNWSAICHSPRSVACCALVPVP